MAKWEWNSRLETGIQEIDEYHKKLFELIDQLELAIYKGSAALELKNIIEYLNSYIIEYLEFEEKLLRDCSYPDYTGHFNQHEEFRALCEELLTRYKRKGADNYLALDVDKQMRKWWENHIMKMDMAYVQFVKKEADFL
jgi:hemerythrin